ncbi:MAG: hypothetical protein AAF322_18240, partial [Pseudomonadota bacterium]
AGDAGAAASETIFALVREAFEVAEATAISGWGSGPAWADAVFSAVARLAAGNEWVAGALEADLPAGDAAPSQDGALEASLQAALADPEEGPSIDAPILSDPKADALIFFDWPSSPEADEPGGALGDLSALQADETARQSDVEARPDAAQLAAMDFDVLF